MASIADSRAEILEQWKDTISPAERIHHELLFYSQGPVDGHLSAETYIQRTKNLLVLWSCMVFPLLCLYCRTSDSSRDLFLHSKLPLTVLSKIWNLADVTNDNVLNVQEFVVAMHLILGVKEGLPLPRSLPKHLHPRAHIPPDIAELAARDREVYQHVFNRLTQDHIDAMQGRQILLESGLSADELSTVWDLADIDRNGQLDRDEWNIACHLIIALKQGIKLEGPVNVFKFAPNRLSPISYQARKNRVEEYSKKKHELMTAKEKRKLQIDNETKRLELLKKRLALHKELYECTKTSSDCTVSEEAFLAYKEREDHNIDKVEAIIFRLKKEHEHIRQETVKAILGEQGSLQEDARLLKVEQEKVKHHLVASHSKATKDPDPFHQLYEERKELRKRSTLSEGEEPEVHWPFVTNPFDKQSLCPQLSGQSIFVSPDPRVYNNNNTHKNTDVIKDLCGFPENFVDRWIINNCLSDPAKDQDYDPIFMSLSSPMDSKVWSGLAWSEKGEGDMMKLHIKLEDLKQEMQKLSEDAGGQLIFRNPEDYLARRKAQEEEEKLEKSKYHRRFHGDKKADTEDRAKRRSYIGHSRDEDAQREFRNKRRSLNLDKKSNNSENSDITFTKDRSRKGVDKTLHIGTDSADSSFVPASASSPRSAESSKDSSNVSPRDTGSSVTATSPPRPSTKRKAAPPPPKAERKAAPPPPEALSTTEVKGEISVTKELDDTIKVTKRESKPIVKSEESKSKPVEVTTSPSTVSTRSTPEVVPETRIEQPVTVSLTENQPDRPPRRRKRSEENRSFLHGSYAKEQENNSKNIAVNVDIKPDSLTGEVIEDVMLSVDKKETESVPQVINKHKLDKDVEDRAVESITKQIIQAQYSEQSKQNGFDELNDADIAIKPVIAKEPRGKLMSNTGLAIELKEKDDISIKSNRDIDSDEEVVFNGTSVNDDSDNGDEIDDSVIETVAYSEGKITVDHTFQKLLNLPDKDTVSIASDISSAGSEAPPLPDSAPPPVPIGPPPSVTKTPSLAEVSEVIEAARSAVAETSPDMSEEIPEVEKVSPREISSPIADLKAQMFSMRVGSPTRDKGGEVTQVNGALTVDVEGQRGENSDSDLSDGEDRSNFTGTFTPGSVTTKQVPMETSQDDDGSIQLLSYNNNKLHSPSSDQSQPDSAFEDMQSSMTSNDPLSNTLDDIIQEEYVTSERAEKAESSPKGGVVTNGAKLYELALNPTNKAQGSKASGNSKDFMAKAQMFAETVQKPPKMTVRRKREIMSPEDLTDEKYLQLEAERRAVISMSTQKKRPVDMSVIDDEDTQLPQDPAVDSDPETSIQEWRSDVNKRSNIPWEEKPDKVNLYSQNVIQETENTESVDRESIANLSAARQHWETKFKPTDKSSSKSSPKQSNQQVRHWEVKLPKQVKQVPVDVVRSTNRSDSESDSDNNMADTDYANESAIEREIRLATEREELLRKEQEERAKLSVRQSSTTSSVINKEAFEGEENNNNNAEKPTYHEMTEADRGAELRQQEERIQQEMAEQQEREAAMRQAPQDENSSSSDDDENANESIIEREIRMQQEREQELELRRQQLTATTTTTQESEQVEPVEAELVEVEQVTVENTEPVCSSPTPISTPGDLSDAEQPTQQEMRTRISYEEAISSASHDGESLIARELREAREREEELAKQREHATGTKATPPAVKEEVAQSPSVKATVAAHNTPTYQKEVSPFKNGRRQSQDSLSSHSTDKSSGIGAVVRTPKVTTFAEKMQNLTPERTESVKQEKPKQETPIEREIRLARERENEYRISKGLAPLLDEKKEEAAEKSTETHTTPKKRNVSSQSRQKFASSRLQKEINKQTALEKTYRDEGKVKSTSEEHVGLIKYTEIASQDNSTPRRNFTIQKKSTPEPVAQANGTPEPKSSQKAQTPELGATKTNFRTASGTGGSVTFSYKESRHKAESKIEQELREMREREEELRSQRAGAGLVSPRDPDSPRSPTTVGNKRSQFEQTS